MPVCLLRQLLIAIAAFTGSFGLLLGREPDRMSHGSSLPPVSGLAWLEGDSFVAVHDFKYPAQIDQPRLSILQLPNSSQGVVWTPLAPEWPSSQSPSSDLESVSRIPGTQAILLVESGGTKSETGHAFDRIFLCDLAGRHAKIVDSVRWPVLVLNVEGTAVARVGDRLLFIFAERAEGKPSTRLQWSELAISPLSFGPFSSEELSLPEPQGNHARQVSAIEVDSTGLLYVASAIDPGDDGPFESIVWRVGRVELGEDKQLRVRLQPEPQRIATLNGLKVEGIATREMPGTQAQFFVGTDDENYGGTLRQILLSGGPVPGGRP